MKVPATAELRFTLNVPNTVTSLRVLLAATVAALLAVGTASSIALAGPLLVAAALTDWADGFLARRLGQTGLFGSLYDMTADQMLYIPTLLLAASAGLFDRAAVLPLVLPLYMIATLAGGVTVLSGITIFLVKRQRRPMAFPTPTGVAKVNYWFWMFPLALAVLKLGPDLLLAVLMYLAVFMTLWSFYSYLKKGAYVFTD